MSAWAGAVGIAVNDTSAGLLLAYGIATWAVVPRCGYG
jgi:hypothetical protein